jgi:hypothetical protein
MRLLSFIATSSLLNSKILVYKVINSEPQYLLDVKDNTLHIPIASKERIREYRGFPCNSDRLRKWGKETLTYQVECDFISPEKNLKWVNLDSNFKCDDSTLELLKSHNDYISFKSFLE